MQVLQDGNFDYETCLILYFVAATTIFNLGKVMKPLLLVHTQFAAIAAHWISISINHTMPLTLAELVLATIPSCTCLFINAIATTGKESNSLKCMAKRRAQLSSTRNVPVTQ